MVQSLGSLSSLKPLNTGWRSEPFDVFIIYFTMHTRLSSIHTALSFPEGKSVKGCEFNLGEDSITRKSSVEIPRVTWPLYTNDLPEYCPRTMLITPFFLKDVTAHYKIVIQ